MFRCCNHIQCSRWIYYVIVYLGFYNLPELWCLLEYEIIYLTVHPLGWTHCCSFLRLMLCLIHILKMERFLLHTFVEPYTVLVSYIFTVLAVVSVCWQFPPHFFSFLILNDCYLLVNICYLFNLTSKRGTLFTMVLIWIGF